MGESSKQSDGLVLVPRFLGPETVLSATKCPSLRKERERLGQPSMMSEMAWFRKPSASVTPEIFYFKLL